MQSFKNRLSDIDIQALHPLKQQLIDGLTTYNREATLDAIESMEHLDILPSGVYFCDMLARCGQLSFADLRMEIMDWPDFWCVV